MSGGSPRHSLLASRMIVRRAVEEHGDLRQGRQAGGPPRSRFSSASRARVAAFGPRRGLHARGRGELRLPRPRGWRHGQAGESRRGDLRGRASRRRLRAAWRRLIHAYPVSDRGPQPVAPEALTPPGPALPRSDRALVSCRQARETPPPGPPPREQGGGNVNRRARLLSRSPFLAWRGRGRGGREWIGRRRPEKMKPSVSPPAGEDRARRRCPRADSEAMRASQPRLRPRQRKKRGRLERGRATRPDEDRRPGDERHRQGGRRADRRREGPTGGSP